MRIIGRMVQIHASCILILLFSNVDFSAAVQNILKSVVVDAEGNIASAAPSQALNKFNLGEVSPKGDFAFEAESSRSVALPSRLIRKSWHGDLHHSPEPAEDIFYSRHAHDVGLGESLEQHSVDAYGLGLYAHLVDTSGAAQSLPSNSGSAATTLAIVSQTVAPMMMTTPAVLGNAAPAPSAPAVQGNAALESSDDNTLVYVVIAFVLFGIAAVWVCIFFVLRGALFSPARAAKTGEDFEGLVCTMASLEYEGKETYVRQTASIKAAKGSSAKFAAMRERIIQDAQDDRSQAEVGPRPRPQNINFIQPKWDNASVAAVLTQLGDKSKEWQQSAIDDLVREVSKGKARFCRKYDTVWRVIDMVIVLLVYEEGKLVIQETAHPEYRRKYIVDETAQADFDVWAEKKQNQSGDTEFKISGGFMAGGAGKVLEKTVKGRLLTGESVMDCAKRCLIEKLGTDIEAMIQVKPDLLEARDTTDFFEHMPGLGSLTRHYVIEASVQPSEARDLETLGIPSRSLSVCGYSYAWMDIDKVHHVKKHFRQKGSSISKGLSDIDCSIVPMLSWSEAELASMLAKYGVSPSDHWAMTMGQLYRALQNGEVSLGLVGGTASEDGRLVCVDETITMVTDETISPSELPSTRKWSNEDVSMATLRLAQLDHKSTTPRLKLDGKVVSTIDTDGPTDRFVYREIIVLGPHLRHR